MAILENLKTSSLSPFVITRREMVPDTCTSRAGWWLARGGWLGLASCSASSLDSPRTRRPRRTAARSMSKSTSPTHCSSGWGPTMSADCRSMSSGSRCSIPLRWGRGGCVATGAHRLPGLRSPLLRDPCAWTQAHRVAGLCVCAAPGGAPDSPAALVDSHTVCGSGSRQDVQWVRGHRGAPGGDSLRRGFGLPVRGWDQQPLRGPGAGLPPERRHQAGGGGGRPDRTVRERGTTGHSRTAWKFGTRSVGV